jgi:hypothetical protein
MDPFMLPILGGLLIGAAAVTLLALNGRIAGISGIVGGLLPPGQVPDKSWRLAFVLGLVAGPVLAAFVTNHALIGAPVTSSAGLLVGGLLVGVGTALGSGCTSGHGVCGMARLSPRSIAATAVFMITGFLTVFAVRHVL